MCKRPMRIIVGVVIAASTTVYTLPSSAQDETYLPDPNYSFRSPSSEQIELGRVLMFDKILSGNRNISCGTCHHSLAGTGDGLSLPIGEGGVGLGVTRNVGTVVERVPRNAPPVWNLGDTSFHTLFHDGRVSTVGGEGFPNGCKTPAGLELPLGLDNVLACQAMFPVTSPTEMAGQHGTNDIANAAAAGDLVEVWRLLAGRLSAISVYVEMFMDAFPGEILEAGDITYVHAANAIAAFEGNAWRADNSPFDQYLRGDKHAMSKNAQKGMKLFYKGVRGGRSCADCHTGLYQTDHSFHAIAMPQIGAGRGSGELDGIEDFGREQVTGFIADTLAFRTPSLRNIALTGPYGHSGAYNSLRAVVEHHLNPVESLNNYVRQAVLPRHAVLDDENYVAMDNLFAVATIANHNELPSMSYGPSDVDRIIDFLHALTDPASLDLRVNVDVLNGVPSGLTLAD